MKTLKLNIPLLENVEISIRDISLAEFTIRQFKNYIVDINKSEKTINCDSVIVCNKKFIIDKFNSFVINKRILGRKIKINNSILFADHTRYSIKYNNLIIEGKNVTKLYKKWYGLLRNKYAYYHSLFYQLVLFPIFSIYCLYGGYYLLHGSLVSLNGKNILLLGLDGVGKSSLADRLQEKGGKILADNSILYNGKSVVPLNIAMRLGPIQKSYLKEIYKDRDLKEVLPNAVIYTEVIPDTYVMLSIADEFKKIKHKTKEDILPLILNNAPEIGQANAFIAPFLYERLKENKIDAREQEMLFLEIPIGQLDKGVEVILYE
jgi:dephospho-CoA kinase